MYVMGRSVQTAASPRPAATGTPTARPPGYGIATPVRWSGLCPWTEAAPSVSVRIVVGWSPGQAAPGVGALIHGKKYDTRASRGMDQVGHFRQTAVCLPWGAMAASVWSVRTREWK